MPQHVIIAGERRSGTTTLYHLLQAHPGVSLHPKPDFNFFLDDRLASHERFEGALDPEAWQRAHPSGSYDALFDEASSALVGHKAADLLFMAESHARMRAHVPDARILVILREPVGRAWSHYWNEVGKGREDLPFEQALAAEADRAASSDYDRCHVSYAARADAAGSLRRLHESFDPRQVHVVILEHLRARPQEEIRRMYEFLDLDPARGLLTLPASRNRAQTFVERPFARRGIGRVLHRGTRAVVERLLRGVKDRERKAIWRGRLYAPFAISSAQAAMPDGMQQRLREQFEPNIASLERMLDRDLSTWRVAAGAS